MTNITPSALLTRCPNCNAVLNIKEKIGDGSSICTNCEYSEPAGSGHIVTFLASCLTEYSLMHDVDTAFIQDYKFPIRSCMEGNGLLPVLVERARHIQITSGYADMPGMSLPFKMVDDIKGPLQMRVVYTGGDLNIATALSFLCETIHEAMLLTQAKSTKHYNNQICLDYLPNMDKTINLSETVAGRMQDAFQKAYIQQSSGAKVNER